MVAHDTLNMSQIQMKQTFNERFTGDICSQISLQLRTISLICQHTAGRCFINCKGITPLPKRETETTGCPKKIVPRLYEDCNKTAKDSRQDFA